MSFLRNLYFINVGSLNIFDHSKMIRVAHLGRLSWQMDVC